MLTITARPIGVMNAGYARERAIRPHLAFRLRCRAEVVIRAVRRYVDAERVRLLDVGTADGRTLREMAASIGPGTYVGVEYDDTLRAAQPPLPPGVSLMAGDALSLPRELTEGSFDVVSMLAVLEHLPDPLRALREARHVLRPGGLLVATCPDPFWDRAAESCRLASASHHITRIDLARLRELAELAGFEVLAARRFMWAPIAILPYVRIPVPPRVALSVDVVIGKVPPLRLFCVNTYVVARRNETPLGHETIKE